MTKTIYVVSESPDRIELSGEESLSHYESAAQAGIAITNGWHGEYGRKYILAVEIRAVVAEYDRPWALVRKEDHATGTSPEADEPTGPTDSR
jgi:hypothetical protein